MIMNFNPINERVATIRLHATPFNVTIIQVYAPTTDHSDEEIEHFYNILQSTISETDKRDIIVIQGDWNAKIGKDASLYWENVSGKYCNENINERGQRLLEFMQINSLIATNTFGPHKKKSRINTWHSPGGLYHNQIDYILTQKRFATSFNINKTRSFPGADIGNDHNLVMMKFNLRLKSPKKNKFVRLKFNLDKLKNSETEKNFKKQFDEKLIDLKLEELNSTDEIVQLIVQLNSVITDSANNILGKYRPKKQRWITDELLDMCDLRRKLKKNKFETGSTYKEINSQIKRAMKKAKEDWVNRKCK